MGFENNIEMLSLALAGLKLAGPVLLVALIKVVVGIIQAAIY